MSSQQLDEERIFHVARDIVVSESRAEYLNQVCAGDQALRERVEELLKVDHEEQSFLKSNDQQVATTVDVSTGTERLGATIGRFKLMEQIGEGGMGTVFVAQQDRPIRRKVALKVIKPGMDTKAVVARFEAERQALAMMDHPNIAKVLDAGTSETGRPYFAMELVKGIPITDYCDHNRLAIKDRLELFIQVCHAIQHAHQKGIIHRDIKPSNVLVTLHDGKPLPKVIDFGVAKALNARLTDKTIYTEHLQIVGTLLYMSPEQAELSGLDIDTRSDIYSLGVLLYELLTGTTPFQKGELDRAGFDEQRRIIRDREPQRASVRISSLGETATTIAQSRNTDLARLTQALKGDLDHITLHCLEKDRTRRYSTAAELSDEIRRYLNEEPVKARPPSNLYRVRKFVRRNRVTFRFASILAIVCVAISVIFATMYHRSRQTARNRETLFRQTIPEVQELIRNEQFVDAYVRIRTVAQQFPDEPVLDQLLEEATTNASIETSPGGSRVFIRNWSTPESNWVEISPRTPLRETRLPKGPLCLRFELEGFNTRDALVNVEPGLLVVLDLDQSRSCPKGMNSIRTPRGQFYLDRHEVTNEEFQRFVEAGGYRRPEFWHKSLFSNELHDPEAVVAQFVDSSGTPGPASWKDGKFPHNTSRQPVSGISWYEADAYARFCEKSLPTLEDWNFAGTWPLASFILPLSNFKGEGLHEVGESGGISGFGISDLGGNVKEWLADAMDGGRRCTGGGAWNEPGYTFSHTATFDPLERPPNAGFRCAVYPPSFAHRMPLSEGDNQYQDSVELSESEWEMCLRNFNYDKALPLNPVNLSKVISDHYVHEVIEIDAVYNAERFKIHLYLPRQRTSQSTTILYHPGSDAARMNRFSDISFMADPRNVEAMTMHGYVVCWPEYKSTFGRRTRTDDRRDLWFQRFKDLQHSVDYLNSRPDVDTSNLAYVGFSWGAVAGPVAAAIDDRIKQVVLVAGGTTVDLPPEQSNVTYARHVSVATLVVNGENDSNFPIDTRQVPLFEALGTPDAQKLHRILPDTDHDITPDELAKHVDSWLRRDSEISAGE